MPGRLYIKELTLVSDEGEIDFLLGQKRTCYYNSYPFKLFPDKELRTLEFEGVTILYGGNGSGKSTLLNILAEKAGVRRHAPFSSGPFFGDYVSMCALEAGPIPEGSQILTSDDVSDYLLDVRALNEGIDRKRRELLEEYTDRKYRELRFTSLEDYDRWKEGYDAKRKTSSRYVRDRLTRDEPMQSNGETAMRYFVDRITENALYLVDEPENSLSAGFQRDLADYIGAMARFDGCQFVIATHSPFLLAIPGARVYDLDSVPVRTRPWTELENVRTYYDFFRKHAQAFSETAGGRE